MIATGVLHLEPLLSHRFAFADHAAAFALAERGGPDVLKVALTL
jgi:threonine dehydrogenase-like Zn-dependent dehydrogenase